MTYINPLSGSELVDAICVSSLHVARTVPSNSIDYFRSSIRSWDRANTKKLEPNISDNKIARVVIAYTRDEIKNSNLMYNSVYRELFWRISKNTQYYKININSTTYIILKVYLHDNSTVITKVQNDIIISILRVDNIKPNFSFFDYSVSTNNTIKLTSIARTNTIIRSKIEFRSGKYSSPWTWIRQ